MRRSHLALAAAAAAVLAPSASGDSWMPYGARRAVDPTGRYYVALEGVKYGTGGAQFVFARAKEGSPPVAPFTSTGFQDPSPTDVGVREGDTVLAEGKLETAPLEVRVSSRGIGFAAMEEYGAVGGGTSFAWVTAEGEVRHPKKMSDLFTKEEIAKFTHTVSSVWWFRTAWIDEDAREVVVVGGGGLVRAVSVETGKVRKGGDAEIARALSFPDAAAVSAALDLVRDLKVAGVEERLGAMLADSATPPPTKLRVAGTLAARGDRRGKDVVAAAAATPQAAPWSKDDRRYALAHVGLALGVDAIPLLRAALEGPAGDGWSDAQEGFAALGERAVPVLMEMVGEKGKTPDYRGAAAYALQKIGSKAALPALLAVVADPTDYVANAALNSAISIGKGSISKELAAILDGASTQDGRLASYFGEYREPASVGPLVRALARHPKDEYPRGVIAGALAFQTGEDFGEDPAAWAAWFKNTGGK
jgi:hypothetical protein